MLYFFNRHKKLLKDKALFLQETMNWFLRGRQQLLSGVNSIDDSPRLKQKEVNLDKIVESIKLDKKSIESRVQFFVKEFDFVSEIKDILVNMQSLIHDKQGFSDFVLQHSVDLYAFSRSVSKYKSFENNLSLKNSSDYINELFPVDICDYLGSSKDYYSSQSEISDDAILNQALDYFSKDFVYTKKPDPSSVSNSIYFINEILTYLESNKIYWSQVLRYCKTIETLVDISKENVKATKLPLSEKNIDKFVSKVSNRIYSNSNEALRSQLSIPQTKASILTK